MAAGSLKPLQRSLAFVAGVGFAAVPAVGPFVAILAILTGRLTIQRADAWWWLSALLLGLPFAVTGHFAAALLTTAQGIAVWLIFRSATKVRQSLLGSRAAVDIGAGLVVGLAVTLAAGLQHLGAYRFDTANTVLDAIVWNTHPALFGHAILVLSALLAVVVPNARLRVVALTIGAIGVVFSGSREAVWAWIVVAIGLQFVPRRRTRTTRAAEWVLIGLMLVILSGLASFVGFGRIGFLTAFSPQDEGANIFRGTEVASGDWWLPLGVRFTAETAQVAGESRTVLAVTKQWAESWSRLQQAVTLVPGETYTLSALVSSAPDTRPGFDGWGRISTASEAANLATLLEDGVHRATVTGSLALLSTSAVTVDDSFERLFVTFRYDGEEPLTWYVGVVPDRSSRTGVTALVSEFQMTKSYVLLPYRAGAAERGVTDLQTSRFPIWRDALEAISVMPLWGWGPGGFSLAVTTLRPDETLVRPVAAHAHNSWLDVWVERGFVGFLGLAGLFALLSLRAVQQRDRAVAFVLLGVLILNAFDTTLLSGAVIYPLAAVLGWRAAGHRETAHAETGMGSAIAVRVALAVSDFAAGVAALSLGMIVAGMYDSSVTLGAGWTMPLVYVSLIWSAVAAASRLYPAYGLASYKELALSVGSAAAAGVLVAFVALLVPDVFSVPARVFMVGIPAGVVLAPLFRSVTKLALRQLRLWGRPLVMLGTETSAARVTRYLLNHPGIGLHPVAAFGQSDSWDVSGLPVTGPLSEAWDYIDRHDIRHAIVTSDSATTAAFDQVLLRSGTQLKYVQYLPNLAGLPTNSVVAAPLGTALALEARNQLASSTNRAVKRVIDLLGSFVLLLVLFLPLALITLLILVDSRGSPIHLSARIGRFGKQFNCIKFRTMLPNADERLKELLQQDPELRQEYERFHKLENDPRVTRVGRLLRRASLDELPQLLNVLIGQMSLVGPRPYLNRERDLMGSERDLIFLARPGMTGYWQIEARNDVSFEERQGMEAHYVRNWSVWWDIDILLRTPGVMISKTGK